MEPEEKKDSIVEVVIRRGSDKPEKASRLVWWIARLALANISKPINIGDTVVEVTHLMGLARHRLGLYSAIGELLKVEKDDGGEIYTIQDIEGKEQRWENARMCLVESKLE